MRALIIDNYDSFVYNLAQLAGSRGLEVEVRRNDAIDGPGIRALAPDAIILSPGPGNPEDPRWFGVCGEVVRTLSARIPTLGVCLGHQGLAPGIGGRIVPAHRIVHGKATPVTHHGDPLFAGVPSPFLAGRYHSLIVASEGLAPELEPTAWNEDGEIMALRHRERPLVGVQFHVESILTPEGPRIFDNFVAMAKARSPEGAS